MTKYTKHWYFGMLNGNYILLEQVDVWLERVLVYTVTVEDLTSL